MNNLPEEIQHIIYEYKHQLEFIDVLDSILCNDVIYFCEECGQAVGFKRKCECDRPVRPPDPEYGIDTVSDTNSESTTEYDSEYEEYQHFLGPDGDFWWLYI